jgi:putative membrane protein
MRTTLIAATVVLAVTASPVWAQGGQPPAAQTPSDRTFVVNAAKAGLAEVELGRLAARVASSDQVKQFAQRMVDDHSKGNEELKALAQQKNITLPTDLDPQDKALHDRLSKLTGEAFDGEYMRTMVMGHAAVANEFRMESRTGTDADVKAWASKTLPTIEDHLRQAQATSKAVATTGTIKKD